MLNRIAAALFVSLVGLLVVGAAGCGSKQSCSGAERCACYPNGTCNVGLSCLSNVCVNALGRDAMGGGSGSGGAKTGTGGGGGSAIGIGGDNGAGGGAGAGAGTGGMGAGGGPGTGGRGAGGGPGAGGVGTGGGPVSMTGGAPGSGGNPASGTGGAADGGACQTFQVRPEATVPTVFLLVDRSGSMFQCLTNSNPDGGRCDVSETTWGVLKTSVLKTVMDLQSVIRFGFGAFAGEQGGTCPDFNQIGAALNNYDAISSLYNSLPAPLKGETPTSRVLAMVKTILTGDPSPGPKYVLFVTDGEPDYCNDSNSLCAVDASVWQLQGLRSAGISTFIFGIQSNLTTVTLSTLQAFANAGGGMPVAPLTADPNNVYYQCSTNEPGWMADRATAARTGMDPLGTYQAGGGNSPIYRPDPSKPTALTDLLALTISGVKTCTFDLVAGLHVDLGQLGGVKVLVQGQAIACDASNGWSMASDTRLQLSGSACSLWRDPKTRSIDFQFPCGVVRAN